MTILQVAFIVLKLCGVIAWPWVWVLAPPVDWRHYCNSLGCDSVPVCLANNQIKSKLAQANLRRPI